MLFIYVWLIIIEDKLMCSFLRSVVHPTRLNYMDIGALSFLGAKMEKDSCLQINVIDEN